MIDTINGRTPEEIRRDAQALREVSIEDLIDFAHVVHSMLPQAADLIESLLTEIEKLERERDAAVEDLSAHRPCDACGLYELQGDNCFRCRRCTERPFWKWRGVQGVE